MFILIKLVVVSIYISGAEAGQNIWNCPFLRYYCERLARWKHDPTSGPSHLELAIKAVATNDIVIDALQVVHGFEANRHLSRSRIKG